MLTSHGWHTSWGGLIRNAVRDGIIAAVERFALPELNYRGATDTNDNKKKASGPKTDAMLHIYDLPVIVDAGAA